MKVTVDGKEYTIEFEYSEAPPRDCTRYRGLREKTACLIRDASSPSPGDGTAPVVAMGEVRRFHLDPPNREIARKAALKQALSSFDAIVPILGTKARRHLFWEVYLNRKQRGLHA